MPKHPADYAPENPALYLILDLETSEHPEAEVQAAREAAPIASVLIKSHPERKPGKNLISKLQSHNIAVLLEDDDLVTKHGADGWHLALDDLKSFEALCQKRTGDEIIGVLVGASRHNAMSLAEGGADYVAIEITPRPAQPVKAETEEEEFKSPPTINWWVSLFETPVVAWNIKSIEEAVSATEEMADFIALAPSFWQQGSNTKAIMETLVSTLETKMKSLEGHAPDPLP